MKVLKILSGVILILSGIFCFINPGATFLSIAFLLGCAMLLSGTSGTLAYVWISRKREAPSLLLVEGILSNVLGVLVLSNQLLTESIIPVFFGMWVMFSGVICVVEGLIQRKSEKTIWYWLLSLGSLSILIGCYAFFNTAIFSLSVVTFVGVLFVLQGINVLVVGINISSHRVHRAKRIS